MKKDFKSCGFLTLAFGKKYRKLAKNLLISFKQYGNTAPFCVVTDKKDRLLKSFDYIIETKPLAKGFMSKLFLNQYSPFEHTIFIDADCLVFDNIEKYFEPLQNNNSPFSPLGRNFVISELEERVGYFDFEKTKNMGIKYTYIFNGGFYYFNKNSSDVFKTAQQIANSKIDYGFPFTGDEPCLALSMSIHNCLCWQNSNIKGMAWFPRAKNMIIDIKQDDISYQFGNKNNVNNTAIVHFGTFNTVKPYYKSVMWTIKRKNNSCALFLYNKKIVFFCYKVPYSIKICFLKFICFIIKRIKHIGRKIKNFLKKYNNKIIG